MNWSAYSRFVGDVFGAPLAMEGLAAFFLESTFIGLWVFGWNVLPRRVHLATVWLVALGAALSAAFIMAANSWMQHPVGYTTNPTTGRPQLSSISAVMTNPVFLWGYAARAARVAGHRRRWSCSPSSAWYLRRSSSTVDVFRRSARLALVVLLPAIFLALGVGSHLGVIEATYQPMKIAAAEAQWETCQPCSFSAFQIGGGNDDETPTKIIADPAPAVAARDRHVERRGAGPQRAQRAVPAAVRARRLRAERVRPVLVDAGDGLPRRRCSRCWRCGGCWLLWRRNGWTARAASCGWPSGRWSRRS